MLRTSEKARKIISLFDSIKKKSKKILLFWKITEISRGDKTDIETHEKSIFMDFKKLL